MQYSKTTFLDILRTSMLALDSFLEFPPLSHPEHTTPPRWDSFAIHDTPTTPPRATSSRPNTGTPKNRADQGPPSPGSPPTPIGTVALPRVPPAKPSGTSRHPRTPPGPASSTQNLQPISPISANRVVTGPWSTHGATLPTSQ